jgi:hypothetical protein
MRFGRVCYVSLLTTGLFGIALPCAVQAQVTTYATRNDFNAAFPGLPLEDFETARVSNGNAANFAGPVDKTTNNSVFQAGEILDGLRVSVGTSSAVGTDNTFVSSNGFANYVSHAISFNGSDTTRPQITVDFYNGNVSAFGLDLTSNPDGNNLTLNLFDGATLLGTFTVNNVQGAGTFFGASATEPITSVTIADGNFFGVDNIAFGSPAAVPEPGSIALLTGMGLFGAGFFARRHKNARKAG